MQNYKYKIQYETGYFFLDENQKGPAVLRL